MARPDFIHGSKWTKLNLKKTSRRSSALLSSSSFGRSSSMVALEVNGLEVNQSRDQTRVHYSASVFPREFASHGHL
ncbi:hypothetical protein RRG08_050306 [Elysia crispata]|uniref:Uncharacterized protein n=1 Tax=Elysia crispata TaxID=231223 RepID=A0AAE0ZZ18_9GAST|nr:hypothetical protein RRG08_050306 [Elysia crispata]